MQIVQGVGAAMLGSSSIMGYVGFWEGAIRTRQLVLDETGNELEKGFHANQIQNMQKIIEGLRSGMDLVEIPEYRRWLRYPHSIEV